MAVEVSKGVTAERDWRAQGRTGTSQRPGQRECWRARLQQAPGFTPGLWDALVCAGSRDQGESLFTDR